MFRIFTWSSIISRNSGSSNFSAGQFSMISDTFSSIPSCFQFVFGSLEYSWKSKQLWTFDWTTRFQKWSFWKERIREKLMESQGILTSLELSRILRNLKKSNKIFKKLHQVPVDPRQATQHRAFPQTWQNVPHISLDLWAHSYSSWPILL